MLKTTNAVTPHRRGRARVVMAKPGLDGHDRGVKVISRALRDAGHEVIYTGLHQTPAGIVATAIAEDADLIGLSILSGAHLTLVQDVLRELRDQDADIGVLVGGIIPQSDVSTLLAMGVEAVFTPGTSLQDVLGVVQRLVGPVDRAELADVQTS